MKIGLECSDISPNSWLSRKLKDKWREFCTVRVPADGDCLFSSIRVACAVSGNIDYKVRNLRAAVANTVLDLKDDHMTQLLTSWRTMYTEALKDSNLEIAREYGQMEGIESLDADNRKKLYKNMMDKNIYWGDQHTLMTFEDILGVRFIILTPEAKGASFVYRDEAVETDEKIPVTHVILLSLNNRHYEPIGYTVPGGKVRFAFTVEDIPTVIENLCKTQE